MNIREAVGIIFLSKLVAQSNGIAFAIDEKKMADQGFTPVGLDLVMAHVQRLETQLSIELAALEELHDRIPATTFKQEPLAWQ